MVLGDRGKGKWVIGIKDLHQLNVVRTDQPDVSCAGVQTVGEIGHWVVNSPDRMLRLNSIVGRSYCYWRLIMGCIKASVPRD